MKTKITSPIIPYLLQGKRGKTSKGFDVGKETIKSWFKKRPKLTIGNPEFEYQKAMGEFLDFMGAIENERDVLLTACESALRTLKGDDFWANYHLAMKNVQSTLTTAIRTAKGE